MCRLTVLLIPLVASSVSGGAGGHGSQRWTPGDAGRSACGQGYDHFPFCNASLDLDARVADLVQRIPAMAKPNLLTARGAAKGPEYIRTGGREELPELGVPSYYWGSNCLHASMFANCTDDGRCSTGFPSGPSIAAMWDRDIWRKMASVVGQETRAAFNLRNFTDQEREGIGLDCWGPVIDMNRDPRWGRNGEAGAECPTLMSAIAVAQTEGLQRGDGRETRFIQVAATLKHFSLNSLEDTPRGITRENFDANVSNYLLADYYWPAFRAAIQISDAKGVMCALNAVRGHPACLSPLLKAARDTWNFSGYTSSDSGAVSDFDSVSGYRKTTQEASCLALRQGGCDIDSGSSYYSSLLNATAQGLCSMDDVDRALFRSLRVRFELGLFDKIVDQPLWQLGQGDIGTAESARLNLRAAESSLVLIQDPSGVLPLMPGKRLLVAGPHANATRDLVQVATGRLCPSGDMSCVVSPLQHISEINDAAGGHTLHEYGCDLLGQNNRTDPHRIAAAVSAAKSVDVIILGLGIGSCGTWKQYDSNDNPLNESTSWVPGITPIKCPGGARKDWGSMGFGHLEAEGHDRTTIDLPEVQHRLAAAILALNKPTVIFLLNGGSVAIEPELKSHAAIVEAFYPGFEGGKAIARSIFGYANRWGRMPYTVYKADWIRTNNMTDMDVTHNRTYRYGADGLVAFGAGGSLTTFKLAFTDWLTLDNSSERHGGDSDWKLSPLNISTTGSASSVRIHVSVTNIGKLKGDEVVQLYLVPQVVSLPMHPRKTLIDFARVHDVTPGDTARLTFKVTRESCLLSTQAGSLDSVPGEYELRVEDGSGEKLTTPLIITGYQVEVVPFPSPTTPQ